MKFVFGPYVENNGAWDLPVGVSSCIDLRSLSDMGAPSVGQRNIAIFVAEDAATFSNDYLDLGGGRLNEIVLATRDRNTIADMLGLRRTDLPNDASLSDVIWHRLTLLSDPDGATGPLPLVPDKNRQWKIILGSQIISKRFSQTVPEYSKLRDILRINYSKIKNDSNLPPGHYLKYLGSLTRKYFGHFQNERYREFLGNEIDETPIKPTTIVSDDFNRANEDLSLGNWTEVFGEWEVTDQKAQCTVDEGLNHVKYDVPLSSDDHYCQVVQVDLVAACGPLVRASDLNDNYYYWRVDDFNSSLRSVVDFSDTQLSTFSTGLSAGGVVRIVIDGSSLKAIADGTNVNTVSTTSITSGMYAGYAASFTEVEFDDFEASDELGPPFSVLAMYHYRKRRLHT